MTTVSSGSAESLNQSSTAESLQEVQQSNKSNEEEIKGLKKRAT